MGLPRRSALKSKRKVAYSRQGLKRESRAKRPQGESPKNRKKSDFLDRDMLSSCCIGKFLLSIHFRKMESGAVTPREGYAIQW